MTVCTNAFGDQKPILDTVKIELPFNKLGHFYTMAGYVVSLRSGTDDITHDFLCKRVEVYAQKTQKRKSLIMSAIELYTYSDNPIIISHGNIMEYIRKTIALLELEKD